MNLNAKSIKIILFMLLAATAYSQVDSVEIIFNMYRTDGAFYIQTARYEVGVNKVKQAYIKFVEAREYDVADMVYYAYMEGQQFLIWLLKEFIGNEPSIKLIRTWQKLK